MPSTIPSTAPSRSNSRDRQAPSILDPYQAGDNLLALQDEMKSEASAWKRPEAVRNSFYLAESFSSSFEHSSPIKPAVQSSYQKSSIKDQMECTALISKFYTSLGTFATPHGFTQEAQSRYAEFSAVKNTLKKHTAYQDLWLQCTEKMENDEDTVMFNVFANLYPDRYLQDNAETRDLSKILFEECESYSNPTLGPTVKSDATMFCEYTEWIS